MEKTLSQSRTSRTLLTLVLPAAILIAVGLVCYWFVLSLPLFWDDVLHFRWLDTVGLREIWTTPVWGLKYFRPLPFTLWKALHFLQGGYDDPSLHFVNLFLHIANACLLAGIVSFQAPQHKTLTGAATGLLFLLFPFSFQAVVPINSLTHPLHASLILAATLTYVASDRRADRRLRAFSVLLAGASIFAHENGIVTPALITLTALCSQPRKPLRQTVVDVIPYWAIAGVGFLLWRLGSGPGNVSLDMVTSQLESRAQNGTYFVQSLAYPVSTLAKSVRPLLASQNDLVAILAVSIPGVVGWSILAGVAKRGRYVAWGLGWFVLAALPACLFLDFTYVLESPRLLYLSSIGTAIFWAAPVSFAWNSRPARAISLALSGLIVMALGIWGYLYVQRRADLYRLIAQSITELGRETQLATPCAQGSRSSVLLVNFPEWYFIASPEYLVGHDGLALISPDDNLANLYQVNFGSRNAGNPTMGNPPAFVNAVLPDILPANAVFVAMGQKQTQDSLQSPIRQAGLVIANTATDAGADAGMRYAGCLVTESQATPAHYQAIVDGRLVLLDSATTFDSARKEITVKLDWQVLTSSPADTTVFAQLLDASGKLVAQTDRYPLAGTSPIRLWRTGDVWQDVRVIPTLTGLPQGDYRVVVGAYLTQGAQRLEAVDASGQRLPDDAVVAGRLRP